MVFLQKSDFSCAGMNRLAAFKNPEFYKAQALRLPTYDKPRIISCSEETSEYLCLPRGCENDLMTVLNQFKVNAKKILIKRIAEKA